MEANVRFDHEFLAVESEHAVHCMLELAVPDTTDEQRAADPRRARDRPLRIDGRSQARGRQAVRAVPDHPPRTDRRARDRHVRRPGRPRRRPRAGRRDGNRARDRGHLPRRDDEPVGRLAQGSRGAAPRSEGTCAACCCSPTGSPTSASPTATSSSASRAAPRNRPRRPPSASVKASTKTSSPRSPTRRAARPTSPRTPTTHPASSPRSSKGSTKLVAQNVSVEIVPTDDVQFVGVLNEYPVVEVAGGVQVQLGDAYGGERRRLVFELGIPRLAQLGPATVAQVVLRYTTVGETVAAHETTIPIVVNLVSVERSRGCGSSITTWSTRSSCCRPPGPRRKPSSSPTKGASTKRAPALGRAAEGIRAAAPSSDRAAELDEEASRLEGHMDAMSQPQYGSISRKRMRSESWRRSRGRPK